MSREIFSILKTGNFYFPINQKGKKFRVVNTIDLEIRDKKIVEFIKLLLKKEVIDLSLIARECWKQCKKMKLDKEFKSDWISIQKVSISDNKMLILIDTLKSVGK